MGNMGISCSTCNNCGVCGNEANEHKFENQNKNNVQSNAQIEGCITEPAIQSLTMSAKAIVTQNSFSKLNSISQINHNNYLDENDVSIYNIFNIYNL